jgi:hypothetical protein
MRDLREPRHFQRSQLRRLRFTAVVLIDPRIAHNAASSAVRTDFKADGLLRIPGTLECRAATNAGAAGSLGVPFATRQRAP